MENETTEKRVPLPHSGKDFNTAKRLYMEQLGSELVTNYYLLVALAGVSLVAGGLIWLNLKTYQTFANFQPLVIRNSDVGGPECQARHHGTLSPYAALNIQAGRHGHDSFTTVH